MTEPLLWLVTGCYIYAAGSLFLKGNLPMGVVFTSYAVANVGLIFAARSAV